LAHLRVIPALFDAATALAAGGGAGGGGGNGGGGGGGGGGGEKADGIIERAAGAAPSPRLRAFLAAGWQHPSAAAAAPQKLTDAIDGAAAAARRAVHIAAEAERALDAFKTSVAIGAPAPAPADQAPAGGEADNRHWMDDVPIPVLLTRVPWGTMRTIEEWLWVCTAVVEGVSAEAELKVRRCSLTLSNPR
jgi:hypothetical protein